MGTRNQHKTASSLMQLLYATMRTLRKPLERLGPVARELGLRLRSRRRREGISKDRASIPSRPPQLKERSVKSLIAQWGELATGGTANAGSTEKCTESTESTESTECTECTESITNNNYKMWPNPCATKEDRAIVERIKWETRAANVSNVTRAEAYRTLYFRRPELHWALLAHMLTRNTGYDMTDLQGELLPRLFDLETRSRLFHALEQQESRHFQDAYPQLLLYEAGRREGRELTYLLPAFGVSVFMESVWHHFWQRLDAAVLTTAMIVNMQRRAQQQSAASNKAIETKWAGYRAGEQFIFPFRAPQDGEMKLAGFILEGKDDKDGRTRIELHKRLYMLLFGQHEVKEGVHAFVRGVPHTGSRADYAPHLFTSHKLEGPRGRYKQKLNGCKLIQGRKPFYSPLLEKARSQVTRQVEESSQPEEQLEGVYEADWFHGKAEQVAELEDCFVSLPPTPLSEITQEHCAALRRIELAVQQAERLGGQ